MNGDERLGGRGTADFKIKDPRKNLNREKVQVVYSYHALL